MSRIITQTGTNARHLGGGFIRTTNGEAWQYMIMPSQPSVSDAADYTDRLKAARPLTIILPLLADLTPSIPLANRRALKSFYRPIHILALSTPQRYTPSPTLDERNQRLLTLEHREDSVHDRLTLIGVRLDANSGEGRLLDRIINLITQAGEQTTYGAAPDDAFNTDRERISTILKQGGCMPPTDKQMNRALAWWVTDRKPDPLPVMVERGHMHAFPDERTCRLAEKLRDTRVDCEKWAQRIEIRGTWPMTIATLGALPFDGTINENDPRAAWAARLLASQTSGGQGAVAISVRGLVEPGEISRDQIDKDKDKVLEQAIKQATDGHKANTEIAEELMQASNVYQRDGRPWPTLVDGHVQVAMPGIITRPAQVNYPGELNLNQDNQNTAWQDMQIGSEISYIPSPVYWPTPILAFAGLSGRSIAGEDMGEGRKTDLPGALLGFTEKDQQPVYCTPFAARYLHTPPFMLVTGKTGSGKTRVLLHLAAQWARLPCPDSPQHTIPGVFLDPKPNSSDFGPFVESMGGMLIRLDSPNAEGILDPVRCIPWTMKDDIVQTSVEMLSQITGGRDATRDRDLALTSIIGYGLKHGADCTGEAVRIAYQAYKDRLPDANRIDPLVEKIAPMLERQAMNSGMFRLIYGLKHGGKRLSVSDGLTLLSAGTMNIISEKEADSGPSDIQRWVVRMAALGASASIIGRDGFLIVDEAWSLLGDRFGVSVVNRMGRLARDQHYMPVFASQKVTEFVEAGLQDFMGRGITLAMGSKSEFVGLESQTEMACRLFGQPENGEMAERMSHDRTLDSESNEPDRQSLYALFDPVTGELERGSVGYYIGLDGSAIPVEIRISDKLI